MRIIALLLLLLPAIELHAQQDPQKRIAELEARVAELEGREPGEAKADERRIAELEARVDHLYEHHTHDEKPKEEGHDHGAEVRFRLLDLSLNIMTAAGLSTSTNDELRGLQLGNHDPRRRGFTLQQAELAFAGALEPYFAGEAYLVANEEGVELEEAFLRSLSLPWFELKAGYFFTEFGRINRLHPHQWRWADQPIATGRVLSPEGMRGIGGRIAFEPELPWRSRWLFAVQNADDASMISFLGEGHEHGGPEEEEEHEETVGGWPRTDRTVHSLGDLLYSTRWENAVHAGEWEFEAGVSGAYGPNASGETGKTWIGGADMLLRWRNEDCFAQVEGEFAYRYFQTNRAVLEDGEVLEATVLGDWGTWVELYGGIGDWRAGVRLEHSSGYRSGEELREEDPRRDDRYRVSPLIGWQPIEMVHVTLRYNFDFTEHLGGRSSHSVWLGIRVLFGVHKHIH